MPLRLKIVEHYDPKVIFHESSVMDWHRFDADLDPNFHVDADPDPDWHQNNADPHADPIPNFN
jgi:hypothetical protein